MARSGRIAVLIAVAAAGLAATAVLTRLWPSGQVTAPGGPPAPVTAPPADAPAARPPADAPAARPPADTGSGTPERAGSRPRPLNILLLGVDKGGARTDVVAVAHLDPGRDVIRLLSLPRDTLVPIPCPADLAWCASPDKLGHAHAYGAERGRGPELVQATVEQYLGIAVDHWMRVDFASFHDVVELLGGISLDVEPGLAEIGLPPGPQRLDGWQALNYIRYRGDGLGDVGRTPRTQKLLGALLYEIMDPTHRGRLPALALGLLGEVRTDLDVATALRLLRDWSGHLPSEIESVTLPGRPVRERDLSFWVVDEADKQAVVRDYLSPDAG